MIIELDGKPGMPPGLGSGSGSGSGVGVGSGSPCVMISTFITPTTISSSPN